MVSGVDLQLLLSLQDLTYEDAMDQYPTCEDAMVDPSDPVCNPLQVEPATSSIMNSFIPTVDDDKCPKVGMLFDTIDDAFDFYNSYARDAGFSVRKSSEKKRNNPMMHENFVYWKRFVCSKEGNPVENPRSNTKGERRTMETHENCHAEFQIKRKVGDSIFSVCKFVLEHTHMLSTPHKRHLLRSHRAITPAQKILIDTYERANVRTANAMGVFELQANGFKNIGFTETDLRNHNRDNRMEKVDKDGQLVYEYLVHRQEINHRFKFSIERDPDNQIKHIFWSEHLFQKSYGVFGDVVSFDTTYMTNKYDLIFGAFTGVNHHGQSVLFGCGLISNENFETFVWLFTKWLEAMSAGAPKTIITDQDPAMTKAIKHVIPSTCHRYCIWHIMEKLPSKLCGIAIKYVDFLRDIQACVYNSVTQQQFELLWNTIMEKYDLKDHEWLIDMYQMRSMWVPVFCRGVFFAGMISSQRSESMNAFIKGYVTPKNTLFEFFTALDRGISRQKHQELIAQHHTFNGRPKLMSKMPMEKQMSEIYTREKFYVFQGQVMSMVTSSASCVCEGIEEKSYIVADIENGMEIERMVQFNNHSKLANCSCQMFEFEGIPCSHVLSVLRQEKVYILPKDFILQGWSRDARVDSDDDGDDNTDAHNSCGDTLIGRHGDLSYCVTQLVDEGCMSTKAYHHARKGILLLKRECRQLNESEAIGEKEYLKNGKMVSDKVQYYSPARANTKGRSKRMKSSKEKAQRKERLCRGCNRRGLSHDRRNCRAISKSCTSPSYETRDFDMSDDEPTSSEEG